MTTVAESARSTAVVSLADAGLPWRRFDAATQQLRRGGAAMLEFQNVTPRLRDLAGKPTRPRDRQSVDWPKLACSLIGRYRNHGRSWEEFWTDAMDTSLALGEWTSKLIRERGVRRAEQWYLTRWHAWGHRPAPRAVDPEPHVVEHALAAVLNRGQWSGREGTTDMAVVTALYRAVLSRPDRLSWEGGRAVLRLDDRELAELTDKDKKTIARVRGRLAPRGIEVIVGTGRRASVYLLPWSKPAELSRRYRTRSLPPRTAGSTGPIATTPSRAFQGHGRLGTGHLLVYERLDTDEQISVADLTRSLRGAARSTVVRRLRQLARHGLAVQIEPGEWIRGTIAPDRAADRAGWSDDYAAERRRRHQDERDREHDQAVVYVLRFGAMALDDVGRYAVLGHAQTVATLARLQRRGLVEQRAEDRWQRRCAA